MVCCHKLPCNKDPNFEVFAASYFAAVLGFVSALFPVVGDFELSSYLVEELEPASYPDVEAAYQVVPPVEAAYQVVKEVAEICIRIQ